MATHTIPHADLQSLANNIKSLLLLIQAQPGAMLFVNQNGDLGFMNVPAGKVMVSGGSANPTAASFPGAIAGTTGQIAVFTSTSDLGGVSTTGTGNVVLASSGTVSSPTITSPTITGTGTATLNSATITTLNSTNATITSLTASTSLTATNIQGTSLANITIKPGTGRQLFLQNNDGSGGIIFGTTGEVVLTGSLFNSTSYDTLLADANNYDPGLAITQGVGLTASGANRNVTGLAASALSSQLGLTFFIQNVGASNNIVLKHQSASSDAVNRFFLPGAVDLTLTPGSGITLNHNGTYWYSSSR